MSLLVNTFLIVRRKWPCMGLRCEVFGHDFGESTIEESYDEGKRGTVLTVREYKSCERCEHIRNISENQGLISTTEESKANGERSEEVEHRTENKGPAGVRENAEVETEARDPVQAADETEPTEPPASTMAVSDNVAETSPDAAASDESPAVTESALLETTDDAVILSETQEPDDDSDTPSSNDDAVLIDDAATDTAEPSSETPKEPGIGNGRDEQSYTADRSKNTTSDSVPTYQCPRCEFELPASESSFFPGDVCPQCRVGYLEDVSDGES
ncbi:DUF7093 family protein [Haloarcula hispanica]|uniref:DUF7093 family protein n=1 Tax=Haloarcula hispanica TaxID=51589 RepID=UPI001CD9AE37|nr:hypothetical protein [Haloarcula hispanica]